MQFTQRAFDKSISVLKIAMQKLTLIIQNVEENWIIYKTLKHHFSNIPSTSTSTYENFNYAVISKDVQQQYSFFTQQIKENVKGRTAELTNPLSDYSGIYLPSEKIYKLLVDRYVRNKNSISGLASRVKLAL